MLKILNREAFMINLNNKITENFFQASNKILTDNRLSSNAKLVYCYLASKPTGWKVINAEIQKSLGIGYDCLNSCWKQLLQTGWVSREQKKNENNLFAGGYDYTLYISPQENTLNSQIRENPVTGETTEHINKEKTSNTEKTNNISKPSKPVARKRNLLQIFSNAVIDDFESQIQTDAQKEVWFKRNCRNLKDILAYCNNDLEAAMFTIDCTIDWLSSHNLQGGYEAVCRNLPEMYSRAMKRINNGARWNFSPEIRSQIDNLRQDYSKQDNSMAKKNQQALRAIFKEI